jgi:hypothetical protein
MSTQPRREQPGQRGQHRPISPVRFRPRHLTPKDRQLMPQHHDLNIFGCLAPAQNHQPSEHPNHDQIEETHRHKPRSSPRRTSTSNRSSATMRRVLKRYKLDMTSAAPGTAGGFLQIAELQVADQGS